MLADPLHSILQSRTQILLSRFCVKTKKHYGSDIFVIFDHPTKIVRLCYFRRSEIRTDSARIASCVLFSVIPGSGWG